MRKRIGLAIIEDARNVREGLEEFFRMQEEIEIVLTADSMEDFFERLPGTKAPDAILSDINLPGMNGLDGIRKIKTILPEVDIIMLTVFKDSNQIFKALCAGAVGYALKGTPMPELLRALVEVNRGGSYMSPAIARKVVERFSPVKADGQPLSDRERQIIDTLTEGLSYKLIGERLGVSIDTVRTHIKSIYRKLAVNSKTEVISKALKGEL